MTGGISCSVLVGFARFYSFFLGRRGAILQVRVCGQVEGKGEVRVVVGVREIRDGGNGGEGDDRR